jgi:hypothetical protein
MKNVQVVIAKYKEDSSWVSKIQHPVIVYDKSENPIEGSIQRPNIGREGETFLYHIINNYDNLADVTVFLQGNPFEHLTILVGWRANLSDDEKNRVIYKLNNEVNGNSSFSSFYQVLYNVNENCNGCPMNYYFNVFFGLKSNIFTVSPSAQYIVPKENIYRHPKSFYETLYKHITGENTHIFGYTLENLWYYIYNGSMKLSIGDHDLVKKDNETKFGFHHTPTSYW